MGAATGLRIRRALAAPPEAPEPTEPSAPPVGDSRLDAMADSVLAIAGRPVDTWAVAATLESQGVRDIDALGYGYRDVFDLADAVTERCLERAVATEPAVPAGRSRAATLWRIVRLMARGGFFFVPLMVQIVALVAFGYSQWASVHFDSAQASTIGMAAGLSFVVTGGFVQAIGYLGPLFGEPGKHMLAERVTWTSLALGMVGSLLFGGVLYVANAIFSGYPNHLFGVGITYYALMASMWLATAALYMLRRYVAMLVSTIIGVGIVILLKEGVGLGIYASQWIGLGTSILVSLGWVGSVLHRRAANTKGDLRLARLPRRAGVIRAVTPFFIYGVLYFALLFSDRVVAWTDGTFGLPVWFRAPYELGLDWALVAIVASFAFLEFTVEEFAERIDPIEERVQARDRGRVGSELMRFYVTHLAATLGFALVGALFAWFVLRGLAAAGDLGSVGRDVEGSVTPNVFLLGALGYGLLAWGLLNATFLFSLVHPWPVVWSVAAALVVDLGVGITLSRTGEYWHSVVGLAAGGAVFVALTTVLAVRTLRRADYFYFSAY